MGREFSFRNVRCFAVAYVRFLRRTLRTGSPQVLINFDTRLLSRRFARETARIFSLMGVTAWIPNRDLPMGAASMAIVKQGMDGGVAYTASFNKPIFNGIKVLNKKGAPALPSTTALIEREIENLPESLEPRRQYPEESLIRPIEIKEEYLQYLEESIRFETIRKANLNIVVDNLFGASREYLDEILIRNGVTVETIHGYPYASAGTVIPYCSGENLTDLSRAVRETEADLGLATDIDGDRFGIMDAAGHFINANRIVPPLIDYLIRERGFSGGIVTSISTTNNVVRVARTHGRKIFHTPVGFKYISDMMSRRNAFFGVESSNCAALRGQSIIKDGILINLLIVEMLAASGMSLTGMLNAFYRNFPRLYGRENTVKMTPERSEQLHHLAEEGGNVDPGFSPRKVQLVDGVKWIGDGEWLLLRASGTQSVMRIYAESATPGRTRELIRRGREIIG